MRSRRKLVRVRLDELRWGCGLYGQLTTYDDSYAELRECVGGALDPYRPHHQTCLFRWLNRWGCRQFALDYHQAAADSLIAWATAWLGHLPGPDVLLTDLTVGEIRRCAEAYDELRQATASFKVRAGRSLRVTYGPTGASKALFALRPHAVPPWDDPIRDGLGASGDLGSFRIYLTNAARTLRALALEAGCTPGELPALVGRSGSSAPKLIDEYNWITMTKKLSPPLQQVSG